MAARPPSGGDRVQHQRFEFLRALAADPERNLILVTATPHSGIEESFRSLLGLLDPAFDVGGQGTAAELDRQRLLPYLVQRRRSDLSHWLGTETPFPERQAEERTYSLSADYARLFNDVLKYCRQSVADERKLRAQQQRVRTWAAIALLRCLLSSPDAAVAVLGERAKRQGLADPAAGLASEEDVDATYRPQVLDPLDEENVGDFIPTAPLEEAEPTLTDDERRQLADFLRRARALAGPQHDLKLAETARAVCELLRAGFHPIIFCRFIATAKYLESQLPAILRSDLPGLRVIAVTGEIGDEERRAKVEELATEPVRVLVATDCLSEGINLQDQFDAVLHYDLPWNPNRLEQREGRVDRFGQRRPQVKAVLLYGADNPVDLVVLRVLIRKAQEIRRRLGVAVPVPVQSEQVLQAVVDSVLLRGPSRRPQAAQLEFALDDPEVSRLHAAWETAAGREEGQRAFFAQHAIQPDEVARELEATDPVLGSVAAVQRFLHNVAQRCNGDLRATNRPGVFELHPGDLRGPLQARGFSDFPLHITFDRMQDERALYVGRTHPLIEACCDIVMGRGLAPDPDERFARCGALYTDAVRQRTVVLLLRVRYLLRERIDEFAEEVVLAAFERRDGALVWLDPLERAAHLLENARPTANMPPAERTSQVRWALDFLLSQPNWYAHVVAQRVAQLQDSHVRLRKLVKAPRLAITPHVPPDILGCYVLVPGGGTR